MQDQPQPLNQIHKTSRTRSTFAGLGVLLILLIGLYALLRLRQERISAPPTTSHAAKLVAGFQLQHTLEASGLTIMEWSPDGRTLAGLKPQALTLWDTQTGRLTGSYTTLKRTTSLRWSPDSRMLAANSNYTETKTVTLLDRATGGVVYTMTAPLPQGMPKVGPRNHRPLIYFHFGVDVLGWSRDGSRLITHTYTDAGDGKSADRRYEEWLHYETIQTWDVARGKLLQDMTIQGQDGQGQDCQTQQCRMALSPDGTLLAVVSYLSKTSTPSPTERSGPVLLVSIWDIGAGTLLHLLPEIALDTPRYRYDPIFAWSPNGHMLAIVLGRALLLADAQKGQIVRTLPDALPPTSTPTPWSTYPPRPPAPPPTQAGIPVPVDTAKPRAPLAVPSAPPPGYTPPPTRTPWPTPTADANDYGLVLGMAWSPDGQALATFDYKSIRLWDWQSGKLNSISRQSLAGPLPVYNEQPQPPATLAWSPDGQLLAILWYGSVVWWDPAAGRALRELDQGVPGHVAWTPHVEAVRWSPDSRTLAVGYQGEARIELWGLTAGPEH